MPSARSFRSLTSAALLLACVAGPAAAAETAEPAAASSVGLSILPVVGSLGAVVLGFVQLIVGLSIAAFAITKGLSLLSKLLGGVDIWAEIKKQNLAVALLAAGVVISYCTVIGSGIESMTGALLVLGTDPIGGIAGLVSGVLNLAIAIMVASFAITVVFKVMDKLTVGIDEKVEFANGNVAIGIIYCGTLIGVSGLVANGVKGIGKPIAMLLTALYHLIVG